MREETAARSIWEVALGLELSDRCRPWRWGQSSCCGGAAELHLDCGVRPEQQEKVSEASLLLLVLTLRLKLDGLNSTGQAQCGREGSPGREAVRQSGLTRVQAGSLRARSTGDRGGGGTFVALFSFS